MKENRGLFLGRESEMKRTESLWTGKRGQKVAPSAVQDSAKQTKIDFKKAYKDLYMPKKEPVLVTVPPMKFISAKGTGAPEEEEYKEVLALLYAIAYTIKMSKMDKAHPLKGYTDFVVPPLEGLWGDVGEDFLKNRSAWTWTSLLRMPDFVTEEVFSWACGKVREKDPAARVERVKLCSFDEGLCVQMMHVGPYAREKETIAKIRRFIEDNGFIDLCGKGMRHHELYLSDPRRTKPEKLKTVLRHPVKKG